jgi:hypothetical protein
MEKCGRKTQMMFSGVLKLYKIWNDQHTHPMTFTLHVALQIEAVSEKCVSVTTINGTEICKEVLDLRTVNFCRPPPPIFVSAEVSRFCIAPPKIIRRADFIVVQ